MASNTNRKIILQGSEHCVYEEYVANAAMTPGHLVELMSTGKIRKHATAGGKWGKMVVVGDRLQGAIIDDDIAANAPAFVFHVVPGCKINCLVAPAAPAIVIGDYVESAGDGTVRKFTGLTDSTGGTANTTLQNLADGTTYATDHPAIENNFADLAAYINATKGNSIGFATEAVDNSGGSDPVRLAVRVI